MAIAEYAIASNPADNGTNTTTPVVITPPGSMTAGQLVWVTVVNGTTTGSIAVSEAGGQTWNQITQVNGSGCRVSWFWCVFNGTWSANPSWSGRSGTYALSALMQVFDGDYGTQTTWLVNVTAVTATYTAPSTPFTVTIPSITTTKDGALVIATWASADDNTWGSLSGSTHTWTDISGAGQVRNTSTSNHSVTTAWLEDTSAGATGSVSKNQATLGGDLGVRCMIAFQQKKLVTQSDTGSGTDAQRKGTRISDIGGGQAGAPHVHIAATGDDGHQYGTGAWDNTVVYGGYNERACMRFLGITIPSGATITAAHINVYESNYNTPGTAYTKLRAVKAANPAQFSSGNLPSDGTYTTAGVDWDFDCATVFQTRFDSSDIKSVIQELVDAYGGLSNAAISIVAQDDGTASGVSPVFEDYSAAGTDEAYLDISWSLYPDALTVYKSGGATPKSVSDTGAGVDSTPSIKAAVPQSDTSTGVDAQRKGIRDSDTGSGADTHRKGLREPDTGSGVDTLRKGMRVSDPGSGADALALIKAMLSITDTGSGADVENIYKGGATPKSISDTGAGADNQRKGIRDTDAGTGVDTQRKGIRDTDTGSGADSQRKGIRDSDTGVGTDTQRKGTRVSDVGSGVDSQRKGTRVSETGSGADVIALIKAMLAIHETGSGTDVIFVSTGVIAKNISDTGAGVDSAPSIKVKVFIGDTAVGAYTKIGGAWYGCGIYVKVGSTWKTS